MEDKLYWYKAECVRVIDGDTLELKFDLGMNTFRVERVRLSGIDTPEIFGVKKESIEYARGMEAKQFVLDFVTGKELWVHTEKDKQGKYGRYVVDIYILDEALSLCQNLVKVGLAVEKKY